LVTPELVIAAKCHDHGTALNHMPRRGQKMPRLSLPAVREKRAIGNYRHSGTAIAAPVPP
jgi:hypothetical protein